MLSVPLLAWFDQHQRAMPWRLKKTNPYFTWLSEIMLQQTTVVTVIPYFQAFLKQWPTLDDLAAASLDEILVAWQGLGYYSRARNLHKCAQALIQHFPQTASELQKLPGIGPYTAAAIASIAFGERVAAVDGNVVRVISRYFAIPTPKPVREVTEILATHLPHTRCGDFTQSLMELGALICRPKGPACERCPLQKGCKGKGDPEAFPVKLAKAPLPTRYGKAFIVRRADGAVLLRKRPLKGLFSGMWEVPWEEVSAVPEDISVRHTFTHFHLHLAVQESKQAAFEGIWVHPDDFHKYALPTLMKKVLKCGIVKEIP